MENNTERIRELQKRYDLMLSKANMLDDDLKQEFEQNDFEIREFQDEEYVEWILLENNIVKYLCKQKFRDCLHKCTEAYENVFSCMRYEDFI